MAARVVTRVVLTAEQASSSHGGVALRLRSPILLAAAIALACAACSSGTKSGGHSEHGPTLVMQTPDAPDADAEYFIQQVKERTDGRVSIVEGADRYPSTDPANEARLVRALRSGTEQMAYIPSRAWERASPVRVFRALQAPFLITDYGVLRRITTGPIGRAMLRDLDPIGVVGLGLVPNELRRALGRRPLATRAAFRGARIRIVTSPTSVLVLRALGAVPVTGFTSNEVRGALANGSLVGVESSTKAIGDNDYVHAAPFLPSNLALFAKTQTIVLRKPVFERLRPEDRAALRAAAAATVAHSNPAAQERREVRLLCKQGLRLIRARPTDLAALERAAGTADAVLERDPATRSAMRSIERLNSTVPEIEISLPACANAAAGGAAVAAFPQGRFAANITAGDFRRGHATVDPMLPKPFVMTIAGGHWHTNEQPQYGGRYVVHRDQITFVMLRPRENRGQREVLRWSYYRGGLTFRIVDVADLGSRVIYTSHPWRRIG